MISCVALPSAFIVLNENRKADDKHNKVTGVWCSDHGARVLNGAIPVPIFGTVENASTKSLVVRVVGPFSGRAELFRVSRCDAPKNCVKDWNDVDRLPGYHKHMTFCCSDRVRATQASIGRSPVYTPTTTTSADAP